MKTIRHYPAPKRALLNQNAVLRLIIYGGSAVIAVTMLAALGWVVFR